MVGSSDSISCTNIMLNSAVAESLKVYADKLESSKNFDVTLHDLLQTTIREHKRIIFNGNGYDDAWIQEATEKRGLLNYRTTPDCLPHLLDEKNVKMLTGQGVFTEAELKSRLEISLENYCKTIVIEANTMVSMARTEIAPAMEAYLTEIAKAAMTKKELDPTLPRTYETELIQKLSTLTVQIAARTDELEQAVLDLEKAESMEQEAYAIRDSILPKMCQLRLPCDEAETLTARKYWPFPTYGDLLFGVN